jgi:hypothetical protein
MRKYFLIILLLAILFPLINAEEISINNGGTTGMVINPDSYIEGFFSGDNVIVPPSCGDGICGSGETCSNCQFDCGVCPPVCGDGTCNGAETCTTCSADCGNCGGGGGGGGGKQISLRVDPMEIKRNMLINSNIEENIGITNLDNSSSADFSISSSGFNPDLIVNFWDSKNREWSQTLSMTLSKGQTIDLRVRFSAPADVGEYNGTITIDGKTVKVDLNVQEKLLLFDSNIIVLNENYIVPQGDFLRTSVTLIPLGDKERMDVTLNYVIKDYNDSIYLTSSESILVENQINFKRNFDTGILPLGSYIVGLELIYPNGVAPSSAHFEITTGRQNTFFGKIVFFLINAILIVLILIILLIILRIIKQIREKSNREEKEKRVEKWKSEADKEPSKKQEAKVEEKSKDKE